MNASNAKQGKSEGFDSCDRPSNLTLIGFKSSIFRPVWPWNLMDDPKNNRARLLYYIKLCASFQIHQWIQTGVTVRETPNLGQNRRFFSHVTLKIDVWPWKTIGHHFYATSSFVHHSVAIGEFKLELQSGNVQVGSKLTFFSRVTLQFDVWPWKTIGHLFYATSSFLHHFVAIGEFKLELQSGNAQFGSKLMGFFLAVWPCNLTYDLEKH